VGHSTLTLLGALREEELGQSHTSSGTSGGTSGNFGDGEIWYEVKNQKADCPGSCPGVVWRNPYGTLLRTREQANGSLWPFTQKHSESSAAAYKKIRSAITFQIRRTGYIRLLP